MKNFIIPGMMLSFLMFFNYSFANLPVDLIPATQELSAAASISIEGPREVAIGQICYYFVQWELMSPNDTGWAIPRDVEIVNGGGKDSQVALVFPAKGFYVIKYLTPTGGTAINVNVGRGIIGPPVSVD